MPWLPRRLQNRILWQTAVFGGAGLVWVSVWLLTRDWSGSGWSPATLRGVPRGPAEVAGQRMGLGEFTWPQKEAWLAAHGIENNAVTAEQLSRLTAYFTGSGEERERARWECTKLYGLDGEKIDVPRQDNLGCLPWRMERLTAGDVSSQQGDSVSLEMHARRLPKKPPPPPVVRSRVSPPPRSDASWRVLAQLPYKTLIDQFDFKTYDEARLRVREARSAGDGCDQGTARAALMAGLEDFLPSREAWQAMRDIYGQTSNCLKEDHEAFERMHLRMGLLFLERRELGEAARALARAQRATDPKDEARSHFWLGFLAALKNNGETGVMRPANPWWDRVVDRLPLGIHALAIHSLRSEDPLGRLEQAPRAEVTFYEGRRWDAFNLWSFLFVLAEAQGMTQVQERLLEHLAAHLHPSTFEGELYIAQVYRRMEEHRASIQTTLAALRRYGKERMTPGVMALLFPTPFAHEVEAQPRCRDLGMVLSMMKQESSFFPRALGQNAQGLLQVQPRLAARLFPDRSLDLLIPADNIQAGCAYLDYLRQEFDGDPLLTLAAYNAGVPAVRQWQQRYDATIPLLFADLVPYAGTRYYLSNVLAGKVWYDIFLRRAGRTVDGEGPILFPSWDAFSASEVEELSFEAWEPR